MKSLHVIYCIVIFFLVGYIGAKQTSFDVSLTDQSLLIDSLSTELDSLKIIHSGLCEAIDNLPIKSPLKTVIVDDKFGWRKCSKKSQETKWNGVGVCLRPVK